MGRVLWMLALLTMLSACSERASPPAPMDDNLSGTSVTTNAAAASETMSSAVVELSDDKASQTPPVADQDQNQSPSSLRLRLTPWLENAALPSDGLALREEMTSITSELAGAFPQQPDMLEIHARALALVGNLEEAKNIWRKILDIAPDYGYALQGMGSAAKLEGELEQAAEFFEQALKAQVDNAKLVHELAETRTLLGKIDSAAEVLQSYADKHPDSVETWVLLGQALLSLKQYEASRAAFERALELYPELPRAQQGLGQVLVRLGKRDEARKLLEAQKASREQQDTTAIPPDQKLKLEMRDSAELYYQASRILSQLGEAEVAMGLIQRATQHHPQNLPAWRFWMSLAQSLDRAAVIDICQAMVLANPDNPSAHYELGMLQLANGQSAEALQSMAKVLELSPDDPAGYEGLIRTLLSGSSSQPQRAIETAEKLVQLAPTAKSYDLLAQALAVGGYMERARENIERALELEPDNAQYRFAKGQLDKMLNQP